MWQLLGLSLESKSVLRAICLTVIVGWILRVAFFAMIVVVITTQSAVIPSWVFSPIGLACLFAVSIGVIANWLLLLPKCARCTKQVFDDGPIFRRGAPDIRDYRAAIFMNSYRMGAIVKLARTGSVNCSWCGHELGAKPDYVVLAQE